MSSRIIKSSADTHEAYTPFEGGELQEVAAISEPELEEEPEPEIDPAEILAEARREAEQKVQEAYAEGLRRGEAAGKAAFLERVGEASAVFESSAEAIRLAHEQFLESFEPSVVMLARAAAERVLRRELRETNIELIQATVHAAVSAMSDREALVLHLNPADIDALEGNEIDIAATIADAPNVKIVPDESVTSGGCVIDSDTLHVDAQLEEQLDRIFDALNS
jgi:flagellar assembly protein FliH